jgi:hypothetical protein
LHVGRGMNVARQANLIAIGETFNARRDIHCLAEVVEPIVERDRDRRAAMHADFKNKIRLRCAVLKWWISDRIASAAFTASAGVKKAAITASRSVFMIVPL